MSTDSFPRVEKTTVIHDEFLKFKCDELRFADETRYRYYSLSPRSAAVVVLARTADGLLVLNEEYRHPVGGLVLSCPGGYLDPGESPLEAGERELLEETGYSADRFFLLGNAFPYPAISDQLVHFIGAENARKTSEARLEANEIARTVLRSNEQVKAYFASDQHVDGSLGTALYLLDR